jgi:hypothetical protein
METTKLNLFIQAARDLVRPVVTYSFTVAVIYGAVIGQIEWKDLMMVYGPIIGFWFGERKAKKS